MTQILLDKVHCLLPYHQLLFSFETSPFCSVERYIPNSPVKTFSLSTKLFTRTFVNPLLLFPSTVALAITRSPCLTCLLNVRSDFAVSANSSLITATAREFA